MSQVSYPHHKGVSEFPGFDVKYAEVPDSDLGLFGWSLLFLAPLSAARPGETTSGAGGQEALVASVVRIVTNSQVLNSSLCFPSALATQNLFQDPLGFIRTQQLRG